MKTGLIFIVVSLVFTLILPVAAWADSDAGATSPKSCEPSNVTALLQDTPVHYSCFGGSGATRLVNLMFGDQIYITAHGRGSRDSDDSEMTLFFSSDRSCRFATGTTMALSNPCLLISSTLLNGKVAGYTNTCSWLGSPYALAPASKCLAGGKANKTSGSITITNWPSAPPLRGFGVLTFRFSPDANITGFINDEKSATGFSMIAIPLAGSATMKVNYWTAEYSATPHPD
ncbi:MAG: hypothetical protein M0Z83_01450 [Betaproteobacteria bacterium]|nr:hypothetical protein [Betaproteobacteria bacterium]